MSSVLSYTKPYVSIGANQRSKNKHRLILGTNGNTLVYKEDGSLYCGTSWMVPYHEKVNGKTVLPSNNTLILGERTQRPAAKTHQGKRGLWNKVACDGGYKFVNHAYPSLAIGINDEYQLVCSTLEYAIIWTD